jgi:CheY-like chemotaxis protein
MQAEALHQTQRSGSWVPKRHSVLVIDDDESISEVLTYRLNQQGYETACARSGARGLAMARSERPSLVLLDIRLPDIDGFEVCQQLDEDPDTCHIPVILLSGMERPDIIRRARVAGCTYYVRKPYDPNALLILIQQAIREAEDF